MLTIAIDCASLLNVSEVSSKDGVCAPGRAFEFIEKMLSLNGGLVNPAIRVMVVTDTPLSEGGSMVNSINHYGLEINQLLITVGETRLRVLKSLNVSLYLTSDPQEALQALKLGIPSASTYSRPLSAVSSFPRRDALSEGVCLAFDGDGVLFSGESERIHQAGGLEAFHLNEKVKSSIPLEPGPFYRTFVSLIKLQEELSLEEDGEPLLRVVLVTARSLQAFKRVSTTFSSWGVEVKEALFCGGLPKGEFLEAIGADLFLDDKEGLVEQASGYVFSGHVPSSCSY